MPPTICLAAVRASNIRPLSENPYMDVQKKFRLQELTLGALLQLSSYVKLDYLKTADSYAFSPFVGMGVTRCCKLS